MTLAASCSRTYGHALQGFAALDQAVVHRHQAIAKLLVQEGGPLKKFDANVCATCCFIIACSQLVCQSIAFLQALYRLLQYDASFHSKGFPAWMIHGQRGADLTEILSSSGVLGQSSLGHSIQYCRHRKPAFALRHESLPAAEAD